MLIVRAAVGVFVDSLGNQGTASTGIAVDKTAERPGEGRNDR
ncbi:hypothetical protein [Streptomyces anulatus]|nr:hypothetical protein OG391_32690 [Streptomyces anulatus]